MARPIDPRQRRLHRILYAAITVAIAAGIAWMLSIQAQTLDGTISAEELSKNLGQDPYNAFVLDTRAPDAWRSGHVPFSMNVPVDQLGRRVGELAGLRDRQVVVMDEDPAHVKKALEILSQSGFRTVVAAQDGMNGWRAAGKKLETSEASPLRPMAQ